jgi:hypothetical protein
LAQAGPAQRSPKVGMDQFRNNWEWVQYVTIPHYRHTGGGQSTIHGLEIACSWLFEVHGGKVPLTFHAVHVRMYTFDCIRTHRLTVTTELATSI